MIHFRSKYSYFACPSHALQGIQRKPQTQRSKKIQIPGSETPSLLKLGSGAADNNLKKKKRKSKFTILVLQLEATGIIYHNILLNFFSFLYLYNLIN